jgi:transforming growth factor-beta-induced protein
MNTQTLTYWKTLPIMFLLLAFASASIAGDKGRSKLPTITEIAETTDGFGILYAALEASGLDEKFDGKRHFTVFAPTDKAFEQLLIDLGISAGDLLNNTELLVTVLSYHVTRGDRYSGSVIASGALKMLDGNVTSTSVTSEGAMIDDAIIKGPDVRASNGVIHIIDKVILPPGL